ncbi:glycine betaine ABC transporter substrate-binding protein [Halomonas sp. HP20-15]|uniref:glycine betaine ABC transporter substrate-binding protein n=1 Tax=Halomonas sp. HP20-15 TaxID=3085901 RepID=UPI00298202E5|nr:glycine betaine ABC transporter substrate-binding protein [Halomonas sp. HP20-15]MDW5378604.1 glycine betaine ABC transporter substrate-binding protein [Halomonas sp. HP20-15]
MKSFEKTLIASLLVGLSAQALADDSVTIGTNNWAENVAVSHMWQQLLGEQGIDVTLDEISKPLLFGGLAEGDIDASLEFWLPSDNVYLEPYQDRIALHGTWYDDALDALVVPAYVEDVDTVADLKAHADEFGYQGEPTIFGIEPGAAIYDETETTIERYSLPFSQLSSSESAMLAQLKDAYRRKEPIVLALWQPHWVFAEYDLKMLDDPKDTLVSGQQIKWFSRRGFIEEHPDVAKILDAWHMTPDQLSQLMLAIEKTGDPDKGAAQWIADNRKLVDEWLAASSAD